MCTPKRAIMDILILSSNRLTPLYSKMQSPRDMPASTLAQISHFFEHYKDLEVNKWVKILGWEGPESAKQEILDGMANYMKAHP